MLTKKILEDMPKGTMFAQGEFWDDTESPNQMPFANVAGTHLSVRFVAIRGDVPDWAIYCQNPHYVNSDDPDVLAAGYGGTWDWSKIRSEGDKVHNPENIKRLVPCDDEALKMYRH